MQNLKILSILSLLVPPHNHSSSAKRTLTAADVHRFSSRWVENSVFRFHLVHALENFDDDDDDEFVLLATSSSHLHTRFVTFGDNLLRVSTTLLLNNDKIYKITQRCVYFAHLQRLSGVCLLGCAAVVGFSCSAAAVFL